MNTVPLGEVIVPARVIRAGHQDFPVLSMTMHDGLVPQADRFKKRIASASTQDYKVVQRGQLVVGFPIDEGVLDVQDLYNQAIVSPAYGVWNLTSSDLVDSRYLIKFLRSPKALTYYKAKLQGSTARRRSLPASVFLELPVFLPPLSEQRRIAAILDKADAIRTKRRQILAQLGELKVSLFDSMFSGKGYATAPLNDVCLRRGEYGSTVASTEISDDLPRYVRITDIQEDGNLSSEVRGPAGASSEWNRYLLNDGDILFARSGATVGKTFLYRNSDGPCVFAGYLIRFVPNTKLVDPAFLYSFTRTSRYKAWVAARQNVVAQPNINAKQYGSELMVPLPPIEYQKEFTRRVRAIDNMSVNVKEILEHDDALFASLQSRAFKGEL
ncbi:restriction endonuclease subunit S [Dermabacter hominis]|uniref:restriction endonuclease subunit S n=1 Tax=Dermabacter hominis TaxID=36740 RepID=UPI0021A51957|nr:restriction endonuclease subunit S [Dermabacter hominis]MCT1955283.1 restriction endonuclease subunit S [Dermabacter hominis]MDU4693916.1 restriction endonuclease subunit S [Dermabacter sp.]